MQLKTNEIDHITHLAQRMALARQKMSLAETKDRTEHLMCRIIDDYTIMYGHDSFKGFLAFLNDFSKEKELEDWFNSAHSAYQTALDIELIPTI
jgi:hypothetical protein